MPGWIVQWYGNVPAAVTMVLPLAPGARKRVSKAPPFAVAVWKRESAFRQTTRCPTLASARLGEYELAPRLPTIVMTRSGRGPGEPPGAGVAGPAGEPSALTVRSHPRTSSPLVT